MMLQCGQTWSPRLIKRVIESFPTSTRVVKVVTDAGNGYLKGIGTPAGTESLAFELVGTELARWFGLKTPPFALINVADIEISMDGGRLITAGPAFISQEIKAMVGDGTDSLVKKLHNKGDISKLVVFDSWIRNADRYPPEEYLDALNSNRDNLFFSKRGKGYDLVAFDHTHCFVETTLADELGQPHLLADDRIYGLFPEFVAYIDDDDVNRAAQRLRQIDRATVNEIVASVPAAWGISAALREAWVSLICDRAPRVADFVTAKLVKMPRLNLEN